MTHDPEPGTSPHGEEDPLLDEAAPDSDAIERAIEKVLLDREAMGGAPLPAGAVTRLASHAYLMCLANAHVNLTRIVKPEEIAVKHVLDSILVTDVVKMANSKVLDIGTGAGYPGIPIAVAVPSASVVLLDGTEKKALFVEDVIEELGLSNAAARQGRAEVHLKDFAYDLLVARAVGPLDKLLPLLLSRRDRFEMLVALKGPAGPEEWETAYRSGATRGFELIATHEYELPGDAGSRTVLVVGPSGTRRLRPVDRGEKRRGSRGGGER